MRTITKIEDINNLYDGFYSMSEVAKMLNIPKLGRTNLYKFLRENGVLEIDNGISSAEYMNEGYFISELDLHQWRYNHIRVYVTKASKKGIKFIWNLLKEKGIVK